MNKFIYYIYFFFLSITLLIFIYLFLGVVVITPILGCIVYLIISFKNFFFYFIFIYFLLSLYTVNYKGYYSVKFLGYSGTSLKCCVYKCVVFMRKLICTKKALSVVLFVIATLFSLNFEKIYFIIIIIFVLFFTAFFYLHTNFNLYWFKRYLERYCSYWSLCVVVAATYMIQLESAGVGVSNDNYADLIYTISSPRWLFKDAHKDMYSVYSKELKILNNGLIFYNYLLKDRYMSNLKFTNLNLNYNVMEQSAAANLSLHKKFFNVQGRRRLAEAFSYFNILENAGSWGNLSKRGTIYQQGVHDKFLFDLNLNKTYNLANLETPQKEKISFKYKNTYAKSFVKELGLSRNLLLNTNISEKDYVKYISSISCERNSETNAMFTQFDKEVGIYLDGLRCNKPAIYVYNNWLLNNIKNQYNKYLRGFASISFSYCNLVGELDYPIRKKAMVNPLDKAITFYKRGACLSVPRHVSYICGNEFLTGIKSEYSQYFISSKYSSLKSALSDDFDYSFKNFIASVALNSVNNIYNGCIDIFSYKPLMFSDKNSDEHNSFNMDFYIKYLNKYYKRISMDDNIINYYSDSLIAFFDNKKKKYDYWKELGSSADIRAKESFNLAANFIDNALYTFKKDFDARSYARSGFNYEKVVLPIGIKEAIFSGSYEESEFFRYLHYNKDYERFLSSYLLLLLDKFNIVLEEHEVAQCLNKRLSNGQSLWLAFSRASSLGSSLKREISLGQLSDHCNVLAATVEASEGGGRIKRKLHQACVGELDRALQFRFHLNIEHFVKGAILDIWCYFYKDADTNVGAYSLAYTNKFFFFGKYFNNSLNIFEYVNYLKSNFNNYGSHLVLPNAYKDHIFIGGYYNYISNHKSLFKASDDFDFLCAFDDADSEALVYMGEGPLLDKLFVTYLNYYKNYLNNLNEVYFNAGNNFNDICDEIYVESVHVMDRLKSISKALDLIVAKGYADSEPILLEHLNNISVEFSFFKGIFLNFNKTLQKISVFYDNVLDGLNSAKKKNVRSNVIFFDNGNLLKYMLESNLDMEHFSESRRLLKDILNEHSKMLEKLAALESKLDRDYIYIEHSDYFDSMWADAHDINNSANYHYKLKRGAGYRFKRSTWEESLTLVEEIKVIDKRIIKNNGRLNECSYFVVDSIDKLKQVEKTVNKCVVVLKQLDEFMSKGK